VFDCRLCFCFFNFSPHSFDFLFNSYSFYKSSVCFQFRPSITLSHMFFYFGPSSFDFWFFFLDPFIKVLLAFNFIFQSNFMLFYFFQFDPHSFDLFFLLLKLFFNSIYPSNWKFLLTL
jgi:hypothetical protein